MSKRECGKETQARRRAIQVDRAHVLVSEKKYKTNVKAKLSTSTVTNKSKSYFEQTELRWWCAAPTLKSVIS